MAALVLEWFIPEPPLVLEWVLPDDSVYAIAQAAPEAIAAVIGPPGMPGLPGNAKPQSEFFTPTDGQNSFTISAAIPVVADVRLIVNGVSYSAPDISITGQVLTWSQPFTITSDDLVEISF